ncbi:MAG: hypothetical protein GX456_07960 [Verrucomicrobia bacterium]|nr:hypothetical protein [Verrucomicrobiota bacterium]
MHEVGRALRAHHKLRACPHIGMTPEIMCLSPYRHDAENNVPVPISASEGGVAHNNVPVPISTPERVGGVAHGANRVTDTVLLSHLVRV